MQGAMGDVSGTREFPDGLSAHELLIQLEMPPEESYAVMINDIPVSLPDRTSRILLDGDKVTIFPPIKGG